MVKMKSARGQYITSKETRQPMFDAFSDVEISALAEYLYLAETEGEGAGIPGSAWEELWKEFRQRHRLWAYAIDKVYAQNIEAKVNSDFCLAEYKARRKEE